MQLTVRQYVYSKKYKKTYYIRTSGKHVKTESKKEEWESSNRNGALDFLYIDEN
jgi:hypothetical protein